MRRLILQMQMSIDKFVARTDGRLDWTVWGFGDDWTWDAELQQEFNAIFDGIGGIVLSGNMGAEGYIDHWTGMGERHKADPRFAFARKIATVPKFIVSNSLKKTKWENTAIVQGDLKERIGALKNENGGDLITFGGATFAAALLKAGLVDELQLFVNPAVLGEGLSIFGDLPDLKPELIGSRAYDCGVTVLKYRLA